jgi:acyl-homoserine lactone acylase PvdQ
LRRALALAAVAFGVLAPTASAVTALNVIPHGQWEPGVPWAASPGLLPAETQARMYDRLTPLFRDVTDAQLVPSPDGTGYFKSAALVDENDPSLITSDAIAGTAPGVGAVSARIKRDAYGVPHIYSDTDAGVTFAAGYVEASDRSLLLDQARANGVAALIDIPGVPAIALVLGLYSYTPTKKVLDEATALQTRSIAAAGPQGRQLLSDIDVYLAGLNLWYSQNRPTSAPLTRTDIYALNAIKSQFLGEGGGDEIANAAFLDAARSELGAKRGNEAYEDLRGRYDPETATTTSRSFPYQTKVGVAHPRGMVRIVNGSFRSTAPRLPASSRAAAARFATPAHPRGPEQRASNIVIASGRASQTRSPLFVGGPQIGYNYPGLTLEMDLHGPNIQVRGATSAPFPGYILIGRGTDYAWTLTSAGTDIIDTYAETLCGGSRVRYRYKGNCVAMQSIDAGTISKGAKSVHVTFRRTVHGPVFGYARARATNKLIALSTRRSSYGRETVDQLFFQQMTHGRVHSANDFLRAAYKTPQTFNSFYASTNEAAFVTSGRMPLRPEGVNPDLPVSGDGRYEWTGYLANQAHPQVINPSTGYIVNWNNKPAKGFPASDSRWSEQSLQRHQLLTGELARRPQQSLSTVLGGGKPRPHQERWARALWPTLKRMLERGRAPSAATKQVADLLQAWHDAGGSRRDADHDGRIDDPGAAIIDAAWKALSDAALCDRLGTALCRQLEGRNARFDPPPSGQYGGWHQYMWKDLRALLGQKVAGAYHLRYCGDGNVKACSRELWAALDAARRRLAAQQGADPRAWRAPEAKEQISFSPIPLITMHYANRPTGIHQVMQFGP